MDLVYDNNRMLAAFGEKEESISLLVSAFFNVNYHELRGGFLAIDSTAVEFAINYY